MIDLSIIIVTYKVPQAVVECLRSVEEHRGDLAIEVVVVDNASNDGTLELVAERFPAVRVIANAENRGFSAGCNQGFAFATGRHILLLNPDTLVRAGTLESMVSFLDSTPDAGVVGCPILDQQGRQRLSCFPLPSVGSVLWQHWQVYRISPPMLYTRYRRNSFGRCQEPLRVGWVTGACFMTKREVYEALGGLDEGYFLFVEEVDYCRRAAERGWHSYFLPGRAVVHLESASTSQVVPVKLRNHYLSKLRYFAKYAPRRALLLLQAVFLIELGLKALIRSAGLPLSRPPDARERLNAYFSIARACISYSPDQPATWAKR